MFTAIGICHTGYVSDSKSLTK